MSLSLSPSLSVSASLSFFLIHTLSLFLPHPHRLPHPSIPPFLIFHSSFTLSVSLSMSPNTTHTHTHTHTQKHTQSVPFLVTIRLLCHLGMENADSLVWVKLQVLSH